MHLTVNTLFREKFSIAFNTIYNKIVTVGYAMRFSSLGSFNCIPIANRYITPKPWALSDMKNRLCNSYNQMFLKIYIHTTSPNSDILDYYLYACI